MTKKEIDEVANTIGHQVLLALKKLRIRGETYPIASIPMEFYSLDKKYDVGMRVWIEHKQSKYTYMNGKVSQKTTSKNHKSSS